MSDDDERRHYDPATAQALLDRIEADRRAFKRETDTRKKLLTIINGRMEEAGPPDPLLAAIEEAWRALYRDYARYRRQGNFPQQPGGKGGGNNGRP